MRPDIRTSITLAAVLTGWIFAMPLGATAAQAGVRRLDMLAMGVDMMPVGTAKQVDRVRRLRRQMP